MALALVTSLCGMVTHGSDCAEIDTHTSSAWIDNDLEMGMKKFVFRVRVKKWVPYGKVSLEWTDDVQYEQIIDAQPSDGFSGNGALTVELDPNPSERGSFLVMGRGTNSYHPTVECE